jgi:hypothetical protein
VCRIILSEYGESLVVFALLDVAVCSQVATGQTSGDEISAREKPKGASEVVVSKMDLGQPECICIIVCSRSV